MLVVPTYVAPSKIHGAGNGLFAAVPIVRGAVVFKKHELSYVVMSREAVSRLPEVAQLFIRSHATLRENGWNQCWDNGNFINHSDNPNIGYAHNGDVIALRDIAKDEEITENYTALQEIEVFPEGGPF